MGKKTLRDIRDFLNTLTEDQLNQEPRLMGYPDEGVRGGVLDVEVLGEDYYWGEEGCFPKSDLSEVEWADHVEENGEKVVYTADQVFFWMEV